MASLTAKSQPGWLERRFELGRGGRQAHLQTMEGLRGFAVLLVFFVHFATLVSPWAKAGDVEASWLAAMHSVGNAGVDLFFVLSGYLIYGALIGRSQPFGSYIARRLRRIYPTFAAVFAIYLLLSWALPQHSKLPSGAAAAGVYIVQNLLLLPGLFPIEPLITVTWSLSYELFYYLAMPGVVAVLGLRSRPGRWRLSFFAVVGTCGLMAAAAWGGPVRLSMFIAGVLLFEILHGAKRTLSSSNGPAIASLCAVAAVMLLPMPGAPLQALRMLVLGSSFVLLCHSCFASPRLAMSRLFGWWPLRWLGNMSYSYYLMHGLALQAFLAAMVRVLPPAGQTGAVVLLLLPAFAVTVLVSAGLFLLVERPLSLAPPRTPRPAVPKPAALP